MLNTQQDSMDVLETEQDNFKTVPKTKKLNKKEEIMERYPAIFSKSLRINVKPTLIPKREVLWIIEEIYEAQMRKLLRQKSRSVINLNKIFNAMMDRKYKHSKTCLQKKLSILYSIEKYSDQFEFKVFLTFLTSNNNEKDLFYLYIRQYYKVLNNINFLHYSQTHNDPQKCFVLNFQQGREIISYAFEDDEYGMIKLTEQFNALRNQKQISYYDMLENLWNVNINLKEFDLVKNLIALHTIKSQKKLIKVDFKQSEQNIDNQQQYQNVQEETKMQQPAENKVIKSLSKQLQEIKDQIPYNQIRQKIEKLQDSNIQELQSEHQKLIDVLWLNKDSQISEQNVQILSQELDRVVNEICQEEKVEHNFQQKTNHVSAMKSNVQGKGILKKGEFTPFERILAKNKIQFSQKEKLIHLETQDELVSLVKELVENYVDKNSIKSKNLTKDILIAINTIYKKVFFICLSIFLNDSKMFQKLVRESNDQENFFEEVRQVYLNLVNQENEEESVENFLRKMFENEQIATQLLFYLDFNFNQFEEDKEKKNQ